MAQPQQAEFNDQHSTAMFGTASLAMVGGMARGRWPPADLMAGHSSWRIRGLNKPANAIELAGMRSVWFVSGLTPCKARVPVGTRCHGSHLGLEGRRRIERFVSRLHKTSVEASNFNSTFSRL